MSAQLPDSDLERYLQMIDSLELTSLQTQYTFEPNRDFELRARKCRCDGMRTYWMEVLYRCHLSAVVSILRTRHWFCAVSDAIDRNNALAFAASFRGCMESAADSATSLRVVPLTLSRLHGDIEQALAGNLDDVLVCSELEDELIHFSDARYVPRKERSEAPASHVARSTQAYLKILSAGRVPKVEELYRTVCDLTHPAASSVRIWLNVGPSFATLCAGQDRAVIRSVVQSNPRFLLELAQFGFNPAVLTLRLLNEFSLHELHTPSLDKWRLDDLDGWKKCADAFGKGHASH